MESKARMDNKGTERILYSVIISMNNNNEISFSHSFPLMFFIKLDNKGHPKESTKQGLLFILFYIVHMTDKKKNGPKISGF